MVRSEGKRYREGTQTERQNWRAKKDREKMKAQPVEVQGRGQVNHGYTLKTLRKAPVMTKVTDVSTSKVPRTQEEIEEAM